MLLSQQPHGCVNSIPSLPSHSRAHYNSTKLFNSILTPPTVTIRIEVAFTSDPNMAYWSTDPFDATSTSPTPFGRPPRTIPGNQISSPGLRTFRRANAELQAELNYGSARWDNEDSLDSRSTIQDKDSKSTSAEQQSRSPEDEVDVFEVQHHSNSTPNSRQLDEDDLANQLRSLGHSPTNDNSLSNSPLPKPTLTSSLPRAVNINNPKRIRSPLLSPQSDPRHLFGSEDTHLPWVRKLSPNRFSMTVSPDNLPRGFLPPKSVWEAEDDEFDRWPTPVQARDELNTVRRNATTKRKTFVKPEEKQPSVAEQIAEAVETPIGYSTRTTDEQQQTILELEDMDCGNPWGRDVHDSIIAPLRSRDYTVLPAHAPARHMHVLDAKAYTSTTDPVIKTARPRLCDAVATVLAYTSPECLEAFLNPEVEVFEWRRLGNCVMIRRERNEVVVGNYYNFGTMYQWGFLVRSTIGGDGAWAETWASVSQGTTPVGKERVLFEQFEAEGTDWDVEPDDEEFALYVGRELARFLLRWEVWNYNKWWRYKVEWEADGKVTNARDRNRYPAGLTFD